MYRWLFVQILRYSSLLTAPPVPDGRNQLLGSIQGENLLLIFCETTASEKPKYLFSLEFIDIRDDEVQSKT